MKNCYLFLTFARKTDCGYKLEPPHWGGSNVYPMYYVLEQKQEKFTPVNTSAIDSRLLTSRKHLRTKVTPNFHLTYSKNGGNLGSESK